MMSGVISGISGTSENIFDIGDNVDGYKVLSFKFGQEPSPKIRINPDALRIEFSNDGYNFFPLPTEDSPSEPIIWKEHTDFSYELAEPPYFETVARVPFVLGQPIRVLDTPIVVEINTELDVVESVSNITISNVDTLGSSGLIYAVIKDDRDFGKFIEFYKHNLEDGLIGHTDFYDGSMEILDIIEDNNSGLGGQISLGADGATTAAFTISFFRFGLVSEIFSAQFSYVGHAFLNPSKLYYADITRVIKMIFFIDGIIEPNQESMFELVNDQFIQWLLGPARLVFVSLRAKEHTSSGLNFYFHIGVSGETRATTSQLVSSGWKNTDVGGVLLTNNRVLPTETLELESGSLDATVTNLSINAVFILE